MGADEPADFALLAAWRDGDRRAADRLVARHYHRVLRFFELRAGFLAEDLTQQTFTACVAARDGVRDGASFRAFLFGIARRQLAESQRRHERREAAAQPAPSWNGFETSLSLRVARRKEQQILLHAMTALPDDLLLLVQMYYWEGMPTAEIAEVLEVLPSTLTSRLARARTLLREAIAAVAPGTELRDAIIGELDAWARSLAAIPLSEAPARRSPA
ncbi:MAG TPA: sigma-70 family RNA polymerase sigma factor [Nannocystaceae bacterium]|nr:sigma-70 family RNA polymerase sigma factor [Nannocystaceae bacterium]